MKHPPVGHAQPKTDTVARAMEILKDRPMPQPKANTRQNIGPKPGRPFHRAARPTLPAAG
jgi:hypothetical protein